MIQITNAEKKRIEDAVLAAEKTTIGEIVPVVLRQSDPYPGAHLRCGILVGFMFSFSLYILLPYIDPLWYILGSLPGMICGALLAGLTPIKRLFLNKKEMEEEVHQKALEAFHYLDLYSTEARTGVLVFISALEHRVEILADKGINQKLPKDTWDHLLEPLIKKIKEDKAVDGLVEIIHEIGNLLAQHFPKTQGNENELPNRVIIEL